MLNNQNKGATMTQPYLLPVQNPIDLWICLFREFVAGTCIAVLLGLAFIADVSAAPTSEYMARQVIKDETASLFHTGNFRALDRLARQYREHGDRTSSGLWKLTLYYGGLASIPNQSVADENYWKDLESKALRWVSFSPDSPAPHLFYAGILRSHGWSYRGTGYSNEVRQQDWKPFYEYVAKARKYLETHKKVASKDPHWYEMMIDIATAEGWSREDFNSLVDEATGRHPYFYQIYFSAINYLTPKWHGSKEQIEAFAKDAVRITRKKEGESLYARIYWVASQSNYGNSLFTDSKVVWSEMSKSIDDVLKRYPDQWNINNFAHFACLAGDAPKAMQLISKIEGKPIMDVWKSLSTFNQCLEWSSTPNKERSAPAPGMGV